MRELELLAPAKNLECGIAAIDHGADAVYIGAPQFGARAAAGNTIEDILKLCEYAHQFEAKVYVTVNTIVFDNEIQQLKCLIHELSNIGVDAILVQDMAVRKILIDEYAASDFIPSLHASTQTDNQTAEKVRWLKSIGFDRVVLARELSIEEIAAIHQEVPDVELEVFVHGALCVSYSGLCYASQYCFNRSANRGECAQFCRMKFDLLDANGREIEHQRHLLSLKDMCQIDNLESLALAGATSFKIEGRLKDAIYVKNVVAAYSERLNLIVQHHPDEFCRSSKGRCKYQFTPNLQKTFNRGYTTYFANGRRADIASFDTPKAMGEFVGVVKEIRGRQSFNIASTTSFTNGDGLCFFNDNHELEGFRANKVEGNRIFPLKMPSSLRKGMRIYRNNDIQFERLLSKPSAVRKIAVTMQLIASQQGFSLLVDNEQVAEIIAEHQLAQTSQRENIVRQLTKLGDTPYECSKVKLPEDFPYFIPSSRLTELRKKAVLALMEKAQEATKKRRERIQHHQENKKSEDSVPVPQYPYTFLYNIANTVASSFYQQRDVKNEVSAFEVQTPDHPLIMQCRYCLRYTLGYCVKNGGKRPSWKEPLSLQLSDGRLFRLEFDCQHCQMNIYGMTKQRSPHD